MGRKGGEWKAGKESTHLVGFVMQVISLEGHTKRNLVGSATVRVFDE